MPDSYGFDHLPRRGAVTVACTECGERGPLHAWPEGARKRHARKHARTVAERAAASKGQLALVLAGEDVAE